MASKTPQTMPTGDERPARSPSPWLPLQLSRAQQDWLKLAATAIVVMGVLLMPPQPGLSPQGQRILAIVGAAVVLWATEVIPVAVSSLLMVVLLVVLGGMSNYSEVLAGFSSPILYFLVGSQVLGAATMKSGLAERLAAHLVIRCRGSSRRLILQLLPAMPLMAFVIPSAINRNAILIPAYENAFGSMGMGKREPLPRAVMLILGMLNPLASSTLMTGGLAPMTAATLLGGFTWLRWFSLMAVPYYLVLALGTGLVYLIHRPPDPPPIDQESIVAHKKPFSRQEIVTLAVISGASLLWLTDFIHHWNPAIPALIAGIVLLAPGIGVLTWSQYEKTVGWSTFFVLGASLSLAQALISSGAASWFARSLAGLLANGSPSVPVVAVFVILVVTVVHLGIPNMSACIALLIPVIMDLARATGVNPVAAGLIIGIVVDTVVLYPVQTATNLVVYEMGYFDGMDVFKIGLGMLAIVIAVMLLVTIPWWGLMGMPFAPGGA